MSVRVYTAHRSMQIAGASQKSAQCLQQSEQLFLIIETQILKKAFIKIVATDCFTCESYQDTVKRNFYASDKNSHLRKILLPKVWV